MPPPSPAPRTAAPAAPTASARGRTSGAARWSLQVLVLVLAAACADHRPPARADDPAPTRAFYYWRTVFQLSDAERAALRELAVTRLYVRLFDVQWSKALDAPERLGELTVPAGQTAPAEVELVPVVFVRQDVLRHLDAPGVRALAAELWAAVAARSAALGGPAPRELQIDCDWTDATRQRYFELLEELRRQAALGPGGAPATGRTPLTLSATIRLHQIKYRERTGVPPVERGLLMFYNMGRFSALSDDRAIFDGASAERYLARLPDYPLPLDVALPIWSWTLHLRDGRVEDLLQSTDPEELTGVAFLRATGHDRYVVTQTAFFRGALLREGDELKGERLTDDELAAAAAQVRARLAPVTAPRTVALFDLSERNLRRHDRSRLAHLFSSFGRAR